MGANIALVDISASLASTFVTADTSTSEASISVGTSGIDITVIGPDVALFNVGTLAFVLSDDCFISSIAAA